MVKNVRAKAMLWLLLSAALGFSCKHYHVNNGHKDVPEENIRNGERLAAIYCQTCHALPDPSLLDSKSWENGVLPNMGPRLGIFYHNGRSYPSQRFDLSLPRGFYPQKPVMTDEEWQDIIDYFAAVSPDTLPAQKRPHPIEMGLSLFKPVSPALVPDNPSTSFVSIRQKDTAHRIIVSDVLKSFSSIFNEKLEQTDSFRNKGAVVHMDFSDSEIITCNIGVLNPNNGRFGSADVMKIGPHGRIRYDRTLFDGLQRPVQVTAADLNGDGRTDYLVCEFGYLTGGLYWMEGTGNNKFSRHVLRPLPGAIKAYIQDYNHDGLPDFWVLFAQGDEGVFLFTNKGNGNFSQEQVLRFPPVYGSSYFELDDFNHDGHPDILYTCGDNADYSPVLKPYHGVYIFLNDGSNHFKQRYFFPINGCYKAIARDFDGDGDLDIAAISFFADYIHQPEEGFVYLENRGNFDFYPHSLGAAERGRWLTMDAGDMNGDGKPDLILGNFSLLGFNGTAPYNWKKQPPFMVLMNTGVKN